ncbi:MAG TPA: site-specific integrase [Pirellulales bacterium]|nr:site-specific integrase [Pirellulales bacterium]
MQATTEQAGHKKRSTRRRGNGEGCITQRPDGRWMAQVSAGVNGETGKRIRKTVYGWTKKEVQDQLAKLQGQKIDGTLPDTGRMTVGQFLDRWIEDAVRPKRKNTTCDGYERNIRCHVKPLIGGMSLGRLSPMNVQAMYSALERNGVSGHVRALCHRILHAALKQAVKWRLVAINVCDAVEPPRPEAKEIQPLDAEQVSLLLDSAIGHRQEALIVMAVTTGMRMGELFGLQWADVDLTSGSVQIRRTLRELNGTLTLGEPKTKSSKRNVALPRIAIGALHDHRVRQLAAGRLAGGHVFTDSDGGLLRRSNFHRRDFKPLLKKAGLPPIRFHDLRHSAATMLLLGGMHPKIVQERLGHSKIGITLDTYSHVLPGMQQEAASLIDRLLAAKAAC